MSEHELKCWPEFFDAVDRGEKTFEARKDDREFKLNDSILLREWSPVTESYTGREVRFRITYILRGTEHVAPGFCIMAIQPIPK